VRSETHHPAFGSEGLDDKETWRTKHMCRSLGTEIYDLAWSPDASFFIIGSMDNVARIYNAGTGEQALPDLALETLLLTRLFFSRDPRAPDCRA
jgi:WD40 repeat protein